MTVKGIDQELEARDSIDRRMSQDVQEHIWAVASRGNRERSFSSMSVYWPNKLFPAEGAYGGTTTCGLYGIPLARIQGRTEKEDAD